MERDRQRTIGDIRWDEGPPKDTSDRRRSPRVRRRRSTRFSSAIVASIAVASAAAAPFAGCRPTGNGALDAAYTALAAGLVTLAASRANRASVLVLAAVAAGLSRGWLLVPAAVGLGVAFGSVFMRRFHRRLGALVGAISIEVVLRWSSFGFHGLSVIVAVASCAPVLVSAFGHLGSMRRVAARVALGTGALALILTLPVALGALLARQPADRGIAEARQALADITRGDASSATGELVAATRDLRAAHARAGAWWSAEGVLVPGVAQQRRAMSGATAAAAALTAVASREAPALDYHKVGYEHGRVDLAALSQMQAPLAALDTQVASARRQLARSDSPWLAAPLSHQLHRFSAELAKAAHSTTVGVLAARDLPSLLGAHGTRHYFVAFMTPAETRGLDGFIGTFAELTATDGRVTLSRADTIGTLIDALGTHPPQLTGVPQYLARYGAFDPSAHFQDVTYSPDFPTVDRVISEMYANAGGGSVDGVLALDPEAISALLRYTGPLTLPGLPFPLTSANADDVLLRQQYSIFPNKLQPSRDAFLEDAVRTAFSRLVSGSLPGPKELSTTLGPIVRRGRLLFWSNHASDQPLLEQVGIDGSFPRPGPSSDLLGVTVANAANNKIDAYLHQSVEDHVTYNPVNGHVVAAVHISLTNAAPSSGLSPDVIGINSGAHLPPGTNYMWLSVYSPLTLEDSTVNGAVTGFSPPVPEVGVYAYSAFLTILSGATADVRLTFDGSIRAGSRYTAVLRLQPLAVAPSASVTVTNAVTGTTSPAWITTGDSGEVQTHAWREPRG